MKDQGFILELEGLISEALKGKSLDLVELVYRHEGRNLFLRIIADRPEGGITIDECAILNSQIGSLLDEKGLIEGNYTLEVSSPGLDRPLKIRNDFMRCLGKSVRFFLLEPIAGKIELQGVIKEANDLTVLIEAKEGMLEIPYAKLKIAKQII